MQKTLDRGRTNGLAQTTLSISSAASDSSPSLRWRPEHVFAVLVGGFGLVFALGMPPCQAPDEISHFYRAYQVSEGQLFPVMVGEWGGGELPETVVQVAQGFAHLPFRGERQATRENFTALTAASLNPDERVAVPFFGSTFYTFVPYVPQAAGIALARAAGGNALAVFYAGRLVNLALAVVLVYLAVRITPIFKVVLGTVALLPMSVHQLASTSPDSSTIAVAFLLTALLLRLAAPSPYPLPRGGGEGRVRGPGVAGRGTIIALLALAGWLTLCKFPYAAITLLYLAVPATRLGGRRKYLQVGAGLFLTTAVLGFAGTQMKRFTPDRLTIDTAAGVSIEKQVHFIRAHPDRFALIVAATVAEHGQVWLDQMGTLGWLDTPVNPLAMHAFFTVLVLAALGDRTAGIPVSLRLKAAAWFAAIVCAGIILTSCYICGCRHKAPLIVGPQGRYFIPLLPLLLLLLYNQSFQVKAAQPLLLAIAAGTGAAVLLVAVVNFVRRYYFSPAYQPIFAPAALVAGLVLFLIIVAVVRRGCDTPCGSEGVGPTSSCTRQPAARPAPAGSTTGLPVSA